MVCHFSGMTPSEISPWSPTSETNGGLINADSTRWRSHLGMIFRCTGRSSQKALTSNLMCGSAAGSYCQWHNTEATDVRCEMIVESLEAIRLWTGSSCRYWNDDFWFWTHAIFSTCRSEQIFPSAIHTLEVMILERTLTSSQQPPGNGPSPLGWPTESTRVKIWWPVVTSLYPPCPTEWRPEPAVAGTRVKYKPPYALE